MVSKVQGRKGRQDFLKKFWTPAYIRLLYSPGKNYPVRGVLLRFYPGEWEVWRKMETEKGADEVYELVGEFDHMPSS